MTLINQMRKQAPGGNDLRPMSTDQPFIRIDALARARASRSAIPSSGRAIAELALSGAGELLQRARVKRADGSLHPSPRLAAVRRTRGCASSIPSTPRSIQPRAASRSMTGVEVLAAHSVEGELLFDRHAGRLQTSARQRAEHQPLLRRCAERLGRANPVCAGNWRPDRAGRTRDWRRRSPPRLAPSSALAAEIGLALLAESAAALLRFLGVVVEASRLHAYAADAANALGFGAERALGDGQGGSAPLQQFQAPAVNLGSTSSCGAVMLASPSRRPIFSAKLLGCVRRHSCTRNASLRARS
jgi:hypothetical protein